MPGWLRREPSLLAFPLSNVRKEAALADGDPEVRKSARIAIAQIRERVSAA
ncbi:hypothetical protein [Cupriavidus plantarum]|uniref:hypothetical protein n=1 Tax=Cupriavidus plantarum TaxID=942865 RepID=UPI00217D3722|nr:hypothetical protein [Cupriavidus plantarum]